LNILALDQATRTGWAFWKPGMERPMFGLITLERDGENFGVPNLFFRRWLRDFHQVNGFTVGIFESPIKKPTDKLNTLRFLLGLSAEIETTMLEFGIKALEVGHGEYMIHWTGAGDFRSEEGKNASLEAAARKGWNVKNIHDVADACGILNHYTYCHRIPVPWDNAPALKLRSQRRTG
jgi:hypothetical protein